MLNSPVATTFELVPDHHESHTGPYGVEMPPDWSFVVTVTEVTVEMKSEPEMQKVEEFIAKERRS